MHHFIFPSKDTYITNIVGLDNKNFGIDEILETDVKSYTVKSIANYLSSSIVSSNGAIENVVNFQGTLDGQFSGSTINLIISDITEDINVVTGSLSGSINLTTPLCADIISENFTGQFTGVVVGYVNNAVINGITYTSESVSYNTIASGSVDQLSGHISGSLVSGNVIGSSSGQFHNFIGNLDGVSGNLHGNLSGNYSYYKPHFKYDINAYLTRAMLKFDILTVSSSIHDGTIVDPRFVLNMKVLHESELPLDYTIYAYPISQSWAMGAGRMADHGSNTGASWNYRDSSGGTYWYPLHKTTEKVDYLTNEANKLVAFGNEGGTWHYSVPNTFVQPTSSIHTPFFSDEVSSPTFEDQYSASLDTNLSSSFSTILSQSLSSVISDAYDSQFNADAVDNLLRSIAEPTYENASECISSSLAAMNQTGSTSCGIATTSQYQKEYSSSMTFLGNLSSSIQTILHDSSSAALYADYAYHYDVYLSSSLFMLAPTTFNEVYTILNQWSTDTHSSSEYDQNVNDVYNGFSSSLSEEMGSTDPHLVCVNQSMAPYLLTSSLSLLDSQLTSSVTDGFSSSLMYYINSHIHDIEIQTSASVAGSITSVFISPFFSSLTQGSSLIISQSFSYEKSDIRMDVTPIVKSWIAGCIPNEGIILLSSEELNKSGSNGKLEFFSKETNTIYTPYLDFIWDSSEFAPGTLEPITGEVPYVAVIKNVKREYNHKSIVRINVFARDKSSLKNFVRATQQSVHLTPKYLPEETYYAIKDTESEEIVVDFDIGTKLSCDSNGNYFMLDMTGLPQERYFKILIKTDIGGGIEVIDNNTYFKVVR